MEAPPRLFAICSWGNAGTYWLTKLLNAHPEIFCVHNVKGQWARHTGADRIDDLDYLRIVGTQGAVYRLAGDVHGVARESIPGLRAEFGDRFRCASLVRHPVPRVRSHMTLAATEGFNSDDVDYRRLEGSLDEPLKRLLKGKERLFFAHVMELVNSVSEENALGPVCTLEGLVSEPGQVQELVRHLSNGELSFPASLFDRDWRNPVNRHAGDHAPGEPGNIPEDIFVSLPGWQQEAFRALLGPHARTLYEDLGYDLSFL